MIPGIDEIRSLAVKYSKKQLANMAQMGLLDPQKAVMAGMMRDRISKEDMQPPQTTVAQEVLGIPAAQQMRPQAPQAPTGVATPMQAPQPSPGIEALPAGNVGSYAGGGIVAFADGGDTFRYADQGFVDTARNPFATYIDTRQTARDADALAKLQAELAQVEARLAAPTRTPGSLSYRTLDERRAKLQQDIATAQAKVGSSVSQTFPVTPSTEAKITEGPNPLAAGDKPITTPTVPDIKFPGGVSTRAAATTPAFSLPKFDPNLVQVKGAEMPTYEARDRKALAAARRQAEIEEGVDPEMYSKMIKGVEEKKGKLEGKRDEAKGQALMQLGLGLMGARRGQEFQTLGESGMKALAAYKQDVKELQAASEKYDERMEALRISDQQAKQTGARADIAQAEEDRKMAFSARAEKAKAENELAKTSAQVSANVYGTQTQAATSMATAQLSAQTQKEIAIMDAAVRKWIYSRPPAEIQAIDAVSQRTGKPFAQAMQDFYAARQAPKQALTREDAIKIVQQSMPMATPEQLNAAAERLISGTNNAGAGWGQMTVN